MKEHGPQLVMRVLLVVNTPLGTVALILNEDVTHLEMSSEDQISALDPINHKK